MLTIQNIQNIEGKEFQMSSGQKYVIGIVRSWHDYYSFGVFPLAVNGVAIIKDSIFYKLYRTKKNRRGYEITSAKMKSIAYVPKENLTLKNFVLELHIKTAMICSQ
jgi:hypothetical protein